MSQILINMYFLYGNSLNINCYWILWPSRAFLFILLSTIPFLIVERAIATYLFSQYEKSRYCKCINYVVLVLQIIIPFFIFSDDVNVLQNVACSTRFTWVVLFLSICQLTSFPVALVLHKLNSSIRKSLKNGEKISGRYQLRENARTCRSLAFASIGSSMWVLLYMSFQLHVAKCFKEKTSHPYDIINLSSLHILLSIIIMTHSQIRRKCLQHTKLQNSPFFNKLLCNYTTHRYRVNDQQGISSTSQNSHFESLSRQWQSTRNNEPDQILETAQGGAAP
ncbi:unnamed protein product [Auanema sp. JU1783]|nr:unnamed protein product [Auanema sp. JU1783]